MRNFTGFSAALSVTAVITMVKKKGGRDINPADAFRKTQRAKEIARNKKERKFQRDAFALKAQPDQIRDELAEVLDKEEDGKVLNQTLRLKKRALQSAYDAALKKRKVSREFHRLCSTLPCKCLTAKL